MFRSDKLLNENHRKKQTKNIITKPKPSGHSLKYITFASYTSTSL